MPLSVLGVAADCMYYWLQVAQLLPTLQVVLGELRGNFGAVRPFQMATWHSPCFLYRCNIPKGYQLLLKRDIVAAELAAAYSILGKNMVGKGILDALPQLIYKFMLH